MNNGVQVILLPGEPYSLINLNKKLYKNFNYHVDMWITFDNNGGILLEKEDHYVQHVTKGQEYRLEIKSSLPNDLLID
jgi:hypothetical protein